MDIDKDTIRPPPAVRRKRPSAIKCIVVLCALLGTLIVGLFVYFIGKGVRGVMDNARNPHQGLYLNATSNETAITPFIGKDDTFDVYLTIWSRVPDAEVEITPEMEEAAKERFGGGWDTVRKMIKNPEREILFEPVERVVFAEKMFSRIHRKSRNLHKDIEFELPLSRFRDKLVFGGDIRAVITLIPNSPNIHNIKEFTSWRPDDVKLLPRLDDKTAATLGLDGVNRDAISAMSISIGLLELHDRNYMNTTSEEKEGEHEYFPDLDILESDTTRKTLMKEWSTYQPHFVTKSHVVLIDESRPLNRTAWEKKHNGTRERSCGQNMSLKPTRFLCHRDYSSHGDWENRLVVDSGNGEEIMYGPYVDVMRNMAGPKHLLPLPVRRGAAFDETMDKSTMTVHHQFTFSSFTPGRKHIFDNFINPHSAPKNATEAQIIQAHSDWEQFHGILGNRGKDTHPRTRLVLGLLDDIVLSLPILLLGILYWYTRMTGAGLDTPATLLGGSAILLELVASIYKSARAKSVTWEMFVFLTFMSGFDFAQGWYMIKLVLPFEVVWNGWIPKGLVRSRWTKRERATRRLENKVNWVQRGILGVGLFTLVYVIYYYDWVLIKPLISTPDEYSDTRFPTSLASLLQTAKFTSIILQLIHNHHSRSFAGLYALEAYLIVIRRGIRLLKFWPWFIGRYETRGGIGGIDMIVIMLDIAVVWQAWRYPRVEQVVKEDDEE